MKAILNRPSRLNLSALLCFAVMAQTAVVAQSEGQAVNKPPKATRPRVETMGGSGIVARAISQPDSDQPVNAATSLYSLYVDQTEGTTVQSLISQASQQNRDLMAARQNIAIIRGRLIQSGLRPNPTIDTEYTTDKLGTGEGEYGLSAAYIQPIEMGGKRAKRRRAVQLEFEQAEKELAFQERQLAADIQTQYAEALAATEVLRATEQLLALNNQTLKATQVRFDEGDAPRLDVNLVRVEVNRLRAQQLQADNRVRAALLQLRTLAGLGLDEPLKLRGDLAPSPVIDSLTLEGLQTAAMQSRLDLQAARKAEEAAEARIDLAEAEAVPDINIFGRYQQDKSIFSQAAIGRLLDVDKKVAFGVSIPLPLFNRNQGAIAETTAARAQARHRREFLEQLVKRDVALAFSRLQTARESIKLYETEILPRSQDNLGIIRAAYELGDQQLLDVVAEQRRLIEAEQQYIDALKEYHLALVELERSVGATIR